MPAPRPSSSKKRKSEARDSDKPAKQPKIDSYFSPLYPTFLNSKEAEIQPLNSEQERVFEMVVGKGNSVFFTGAAGTWSLHIHNPFHLFPSLCCFLTVQERGNRYYFELSLWPSRRSMQRNRLQFP